VIFANKSSWRFMANMYHKIYTPARPPFRALGGVANRSSLV
jgi:hypothetical protein